MKGKLGDDEAVQEASSRHQDISSMLSDLDHFKSSVFTECFSINLTPDSASQATNNIQNIKNSLDAWRDSVKMRLDEVDALCREQGDSLPPEQFSELREARHKLAANYDNVVRTVEGVYGRLNIITVLLLEFSTAASSTQSWITDCTRLAGDIKSKSADSNQFSKQYAASRQLLENVQDGESRLKEISTIVRKLEQEIGLLYDESPMGTPRTLNTDEVTATFFRVQSDYEILLKMCQELLQFQNRLSVLDGDVLDKSRALDERLTNVENNLSDFDQSKGIRPQSKMKTVENLQGKAREIDDKVDQFEQATLRLLSHLEGSGAPEEIRDLKQADVAKAKRRHSSLVDQLQDRKNKVNIELAENEGVKDAINTLGQWAREFEKKVSQPVALPLNEQSLQELKKETQANQSELEAKQGVLEQLEKAAERLPEGTPDLTEVKSKMARASVQLKGLRDNINDALAGEQSFSLGCESLARSCDILSNNLKNTAPRDTQRLLDCEEDLATLAGSLESLEATAALLKSLPNTVGTEKLDQRIGEYRKRVAGLSRDLATKRAKNSEAAGLEKQIQGLRQEAQEWLGLFDGELLELGPVSVNLEKLQDQRRQAQELQEKHREGLGLMEELEGALAQLGESEGSAGSRNSSVPRHLIDLMTRLNGQSDLLRNRLSKIGDNEIKALDLDETKKDVESWIDGQSQSLEALLTPSTKDELQTITSQIDKIEKGARQERRKVEDVHLKSRELARRASLPSESDQILKEDEKLENKWNEMQDQIEARLDRNRKVAQLLDGATQLEKWLGTKEKMILAIGAPSTEPAVSRSQIAQLQIIKGEAEGEKPTLESLLENAEALARTDPNAGSLLERVRILERRWKSLDEGMLSKEEAIKATDCLSQEMKRLQKEIKGRLGEIESSLDNTTHLFPGDIEKQLNSLEDLRIQHKDLGDYVKELEEKLKSTEELEIDPANRDEIEEQVQKTKRRVNDLGQKIDGTKTAVLTALNEGAAVDEQLNALLGVVRSAAADIQQFPPIIADPAKLAEQLTAVNTLHNGLLTKEAEVPMVKALVAKQLKKKHDPELKAKCDELSKAWGPLLVATLDRKSAVEKADDLIKHFNDSEKSLSHRLKEDEKEIEAVAAEAGQDSTVLQTLQAVDNILARRSADAEALIGLVDRIEQVAPGPDANKLKRKAENLLDDCKALSRKAKNVAGESKKRADIKARIERLLSESRDFAGSQESLLKNSENINKERIGPQIAEVSDFWNRKKRDLSNCLDEAKEAKIDVSPLGEELPQLDDRFSAILARLSDLAQSFSDKQNAAQKILDLVSGVAREVDDLNNEINDLDSTAHCKEELEKQKQQCLAIGGQLEEEKEKVKGAMTETEKALEDGVVGRLQHDSAKNSLENADKILSRCQKKIEQREKKLEQTAAEVEQFEAESKALAGELGQLMAALTAPIEVADLKKQSAELKQLKDSVKPLADRVDSFSSECKVLIKAAGPEAKTTELDEALQRVTEAWNKVASALAEKEMKVDSAAQELGRYEDAYRNLLNWLEETEEGLENIGKPSSDAKAAKLQLGTYNLLLKHIEDKEASVAGFNTLIGKLVDLAQTESEKSGLRDKASGITKRYDALLGEAQDRQGKVIEAIDLAERLGEIMTPLSVWIAKTEKRVQALSSIATASSKMEEQLAAQAELEQEVDQKGDDLSVMDQLVPLLANLVSVKDAEELETQANNLGNSYDSLANRVHAIRELLADVATQVGDFEHDTNALASWLDEMEESLLHVDELAIEPDDLLEQSNILTDLAQAVTERDALVSNVVSVGKVLCKQTTTDEAIALQNRIEVLKNRYVDIMAVADEKLAHLSKAIPLSERFHDGFEAVIQWVEAVEEDLQNIDEADITTQAQLIFTLEEDVQNWRPEVEDLVGVSNQLQALSSRDKAEELYQNTTEMNRRVNQIADKVSRRAERLDVTEKQSRAVLDDLEFIVEWLADARERLLTADPPSIDPEFLNRQLKNQRIMNEDVTLNKGKLRDVITEAKKIARQIGIDSPDSAATAALNEKCELGKDLVDEVSNLCMERTEHLERAKVLTEQLTLEFEELSQWLDNLEDELRSAPDVNTTTPQAELQKMNLHNSELMAAVIAYQPIVNTFDKDVKAMLEVCHEKEGEKLRELADELLDRYKEIGEAIRSRGQGIDSVMDTTSVFEERLSKLVENLEGAADKLRETGGVSADPVILETKLAENSAILENLQNKKAAYNHLREDAAGLLASAPEGDVAAQDVMSKLNRLEKLWGDIEQEAALRGDFLSDVLGKAKHFWNELDDCQRAVDDLRYRLESVEPATGQPQQLQAQQAELASVANEINVTGPRIVALKQAGDALSSVIPLEEQDVVRTQVEAVQNGWGTITTLFADKNRDLIQAMEDAMTFHGDLNDLLGWLDQAEHTLALMPPAESLKIDEIPSALEELRHFKDDVDQHGILKEQLAQTAANLAEGATAAQAAVVRQPISELNVRWAKLYGAMADREYKVEMALLQMGKLSEAAGQLMDWIDRSKATVVDLAANTTPRNLRNVEIQICKLAVLKNDVDAHRPSVDTLNAAAKRLLKDGGDSVAAGKIDEMNQKWTQLNQDIEEIGKRMDQAKMEAESVGGELERWLSWLDDVEQQLATTRPTGGLPETAQTQMDDFRVLRAEIEQNAPALEGYLKETGIYLLEHGNDQESWIGRSHGQMKSKWNKVKELCADREKKLQLALEEAIALDDAMRDTADWLASAEQSLTQLEPVSHILEKAEKQNEDLEAWKGDVAKRKQLMAEQQAAGRRLQVYCEKKDAIPIKNGLVSLKHRFEKVVARTNERGKLLAVAMDEAKTWLTGVEQVEDCLFQVEEALASDAPSTSNVDRLKEHMNEIKELQKQMAETQPYYEMTKKRGSLLAERSTKLEAKQINARNNEIASRWAALTKRCVERQRAAEQAVLEGGVFDEAMKELEDWIDKEIARKDLPEYKKVHGDVDTVKELRNEENQRAAERLAKKKGVNTLLKKAEDMMAKGVDEAEAVGKDAERLRDKWGAVEEAANERDRALSQAEDEAAKFDAQAHGLLEWLAKIEQKLKEPVKDLPLALAQVNAIKKELDAERPKKDDCLAKGQELTAKCHPKAEQALKHWIRVIDGRWKEVEERCAEKEFTVLEDEQKEAERDTSLKELHDFIIKKRDELARMSSNPMANDLEALEKLEKEYESLDFDLRDKQGDVDNAVKSARKGVNDPRGNQLQSEWKKLWLEALGYQQALENQRALLEEMKRLEGWKWEQWKDRYVEWNDHGKARVSDLFRRIDRTHTGNVPRNTFIDAIIASKFPTSRLEMDKVADLFDKGDGMINSKEFIDALRFPANRAKPVTDGEKINYEIEKQRSSCSCCNKYRIEKISDNHYKFGDTEIKRMVRILRSTVMVRVGGGWEALDVFLGKHDPCRINKRLNVQIYKELAPAHAIDTIAAFTKNRHARGSLGATPGPITKVREKTERSIPMSSLRHERAPSDLSSTESRIPRPSFHNSRSSLAESSRPPSRAGSECSESNFQSRIPSLRAKKGSRYVPPK